MKTLKWVHFSTEIILLNVSWYLRYALSYRDLEEMVFDRGLKVDHSTIQRWVIKYTPFFIKLRTGKRRGVI